MPALRHLSGLALALGLVAMSAPPAYADFSPQGDVVAAWPTTWSTYRLATGTPVLDALGDENPDYSDLSSGPCTGSGCTGTSPTVYYASDGTNAFFRMRLAVDPYDATKGGLTGSAYLTQIAVNGTVVAVVGVDGKDPAVDYVYVASAPGTTVTQIYTWPFTTTSAGMRVVSDGAGDWFLDYQVPIASLTTISGGAITATTPIQLYYGSSAAANLATLNKDLMRGAVNTVSFTGLATITLSPSTLSATSTATHLSGPSTPVVGQPTRYTVTWTMTNGGGGDLTPASASATLPTGVTFVSGSGVTVSGSTVTWNAGLLVAGETDTVSFVVELTPPPGSEGTMRPLLSALSASGTDVGTSSPRTASAPALTAGPVAAAPPTNSAPTAAADTLTVAEDTPGSVNVLANDSDADGDTLTVTVTGAPAHGTTSVAGGVVTYTPVANYAGPDTFTYTACDPSGACAPATVTVTVTAVNDAPTLAGTSFATPEDTPRSGTLPAGADVEGDALTYAVTTAPSHGTVVVNPDGTFTYTPAPGYSGPDSFGYRACDPGGLCGNAVATVEVTSVNDAPVAAATYAASTAEDTPLNGSVPAASDPDGDALTYATAVAPVNGTVVVDEDGSFTYTPAANYAGPDSFTYEVCDAGGLCDTGVVNLTVTPVNDAPVAAAPHMVSTPEDTPVDGTVPAGSDVDGDALTYAVTTAPAHGSVVVDEDGTFTYTPAANYSGPDSFGYEVCDPAGLCDTGVVSVNVTPVNDAPVAAPAAAVSTAEDTPLSGSVPAASDAEGGALTYSLSAAPAHGTVTVGPDGSYTYTPGPDYAGPDSFGYTVCDAAGLCDTGVVNVTVTPVNDAPVAVATAAASTPEDTPLDGSVPAATDVDGDALTYALTTAPAHGTVTVAPNGTYTFTPAPNYNGPDTFGYRVCDPAGLCDTGVVNVTVVPVNDPPSAPAPTSFTTSEDTPYSGTLPGSTDPDGDALTHSVTTPPAHGTVVVNPDGTYTYTPAPGYEGGDTFGYQVCDPAGLCAGATATVTVTGAPPLNLPPDVNDDSAGTPYETPVLVPVLANDVDTDALTITSAVAGGAGTVTIVPGGVLYTPAPGFSGPALFEYTACDTANQCDAAQVLVTVAARANTPPVADAGPDQSAKQGATVTLDGTKSSDPDGTTLTYVWKQVGGAPVALTGAGTATPTFVMPAGGSVVFELTVSDGVTSDTDTVTVAALPVVVPPAPVCDDEAITTVNGAAVVVTIDCENAAGATVTIVDAPDHGDAVVLEDGTIRYVPDAGYSGPDSFSVRVCTAAGCTDALVTAANGLVRRPSRLPNTGSSPVEVLLPAAFVLLALGAAAQRRGTRAHG